MLVCVCFLCFSFWCLICFNSYCLLYVYCLIISMYLRLFVCLLCSHFLYCFCFCPFVILLLFIIMFVFSYLYVFLFVYCCCIVFSCIYLSVSFRVCFLCVWFFAYCFIILYAFFFVYSFCIVLFVLLLLSMGSWARDAPDSSESPRFTRIDELETPVSAESEWARGTSSAPHTQLITAKTQIKQTK